MNDKGSAPFGLGPAFVYEWLIASRRWQTYALRSGFVVALLVALYAIQSSRPWPQGPTSIRALAEIGTGFCVALVGTQLTLVLMAAPAVTAGAICLDRARGTLTHLLMTDLSDREIVLGKLAGRLASVLVLICCTLPVMSLLTLLGGVDPVALVGAYAVTVGVALLGACLAFLFSLWAGKTHEALLGTYAVWGLWILGGPMISLLNASFSWLSLPNIPYNANPYLLISAPYLWPGTFGWKEPFIFSAVCVAISAILTLITVLRLRPICTRDGGVRRQRSRQSERRTGGLVCESALRRFVGKLRPPLDCNPVLWREWHRTRPSRWAVIVGTLYVALAVGFSGLAIWSGPSRLAFQVIASINGYQVAIGLLLLSVTAATSLAEERVRGSLDVLMVTPLSTRQIVLGKWLGTFRVVPLLAVLPALVILGCGKDYERLVGALLIAAYVIATGAAVTSVGLAFATWIPRLGRAVGLTVTLYVLVTVGWCIVVEIFAGNGRSENLLLGSPFCWAIGVSLNYCGGNTPNLEEVLSLAPFWLFFNAIVAIGFLALTLATFNRCMGRVEYHVTRSPLLRRDRKRPKSEPALRL